MAHPPFFGLPPLIFGIASEAEAGAGCATRAGGPMVIVLCSTQAATPRAISSPAVRTVIA